MRKCVKKALLAVFAVSATVLAVSAYRAPSWYLHLHQNMRGILLSEAGSLTSVEAIQSLMERATGELEGEMKYSTMERFRHEGALEIEFSQSRAVMTAFGKEIKFRRLFITPPNEDEWLLMVPGLNSYNGHPLRVPQAKQDFETIVSVVTSVTASR